MDNMSTNINELENEIDIQKLTSNIHKEIELVRLMIISMLKD